MPLAKKKINYKTTTMERKKLTTKQQLWKEKK